MKQSDSECMNSEIECINQRVNECVDSSAEGMHGFIERVNAGMNQIVSA